MSDNETLERFHQWRNIGFGEDACKTCNGSGIRAYGNTSTWMRGIGGQSVTSGVCDVCWGSGTPHRPGPDLRKLRGKMDALKAENARLRAALEEIRDSPHQSYDMHGPASSDADHQYKIGIADGHRCAGNVARRALEVPARADDVPAASDDT